MKKMPPDIGTNAFLGQNGTTLNTGMMGHLNTWEKLYGLKFASQQVQKHKNIGKHQFSEQDCGNPGSI